MLSRIHVHHILKQPNLVLCTTDTIQEAAAGLYRLKDEAVPVVDADGKAAGWISADTLMSSMMNGLGPDTHVEAVMEKPDVMLREHDVPAGWRWLPPVLPVADEAGGLAGVIHADDWLKEADRLAAAERKELLRVLCPQGGMLCLLSGSGEILASAGTEAAELQEIPGGGELLSYLHGKAEAVPTTVEKEGRTYHLLAEPAGGSFLLQVRSDEAPADEAWKDKAEQMEMVIELSSDGIIMVDRSGIITMVNNEYAQFIGMKEEDMVGRHVADIIENTRMHIVAETGKPEIADIQKINGDYMVANRLPLYKDGELDGAVGKVLFKNLGGFKALKRRIEKLERELDSYKGEWRETNRASYQFHQLLGKSAAWNRTKEMARQAAATDSSVLLQGESGTGKELFAHAIHLAGPRAPGPFVKVNCAAIPGDLIESELFGYVEGSFTGAKRGGKKGKFEAADGGTIFLDEIGELPLHLQVKLLRVLQEREVEPVGATASRSVDIRVIAATNRDLESMIEDEQFRLDLYYRLNVFSILIPPLRERTDDLEELVPHFLARASERTGTSVAGVDEDVWRLLRTYSWPGNTRELENVLERSVTIARGSSSLKPEHLPPSIRGDTMEKPAALQQVLQEAEQRAVEQAIRYADGNKSLAASLLGISRTSLYEKLKRYEKV
ncbi:sigma 54-interacting transcriptional regulator [Alkalicoccus luteus]|uniref:sigma 54-interacting transcriptional regulator n=1 Tax=Alkalicoccus luteus TaxID=1237094 RepID=UPI004033E341